jgi:hypothetical protein
MFLVEPTTGYLESLVGPDRAAYDRLPVRCPAGDYDEVVDRYVKRARQVAGVIGVARFGNVSAPGISDLDLVVITEPHLAQGAAALLSVARLPEFDRELMLHDPVVVPEENIGHVFDHLDVPQLTTVWGRVPAAPPPAGQEGRWRRLSILLEWLPSFQVYFAKLAASRRVDVRWALPVLHSIRYSVALASEFLGDDFLSDRSLSQEVEQLRSEWFDLGCDAERVRRLALLIPRGWQLTADLCFQLDRWLLHENLLPCLGNSSLWSIYSGDGRDFSIPVRVAAAADYVAGQITLNSYPPGLRWLPRALRRRLNPCTYTLLPSFVLAFIKAPVGRAPLVGQRLADRWVAGWPFAKLQPQTGLEHHLVGFAGRLENQATFLKRNGLWFGNANFLAFWPDWGSSQDSRRKGLLRTLHLRRAVKRVRTLARLSRL